MAKLTNSYDDCTLLNLVVFALPEKEKEQFIFNSSAGAMTLLPGLASDPVVEDGLPEGRSRAELERAAESTITVLWGRIRAAQASKMTP